MIIFVLILNYYYKDTFVCINKLITIATVIGRINVNSEFNNCSRIFPYHLQISRRFMIAFFTSAFHLYIFHIQQFILNRCKNDKRIVHQAMFYFVAKSNTLVCKYRLNLEQPHRNNGSSFDTIMTNSTATTRYNSRFLTYVRAFVKSCMSDYNFEK